MSGGSLNYFCHSLEEHIGDFEDRELDDLVKDLAELFHDREWYLSSDTCEGAWREARDRFKEKWFTDYGRKERIEKYFQQMASEVFDSLGFGTYCKDCVEWTPQEEDSPYGKCNLNEHCLMHRSEHCDRFEIRACGDTE